MDKTDIRIPTDEELTAYMEESAVSANGSYEQSPVDDWQSVELWVCQYHDGY